MDSSSIAYEEGSCAPKRGYAGKSYAGVERKQKNLRHGIRYEQTPILQNLPLVGSKVRFLERIVEVDPQEVVRRIHYKEQRRECVYTVLGYSQGIENPLAQNNFVSVSYKAKSGLSLAYSVRALDISLGIIKVINMDDEYEEVDAK